MQRMRTKIYINSNKERHEFVYTGIEFHEFIQYLENPIENIALLKANYLGNDCQNYFELVEGNEYVKLLAKEDVHNFGDFCFMDYAKHGDINLLTDEQIAEVLYMAHMYKSLKSPFFDIIGNRFTYLAHDDGFFCKLYCRNISEFDSILAGKISGILSKRNKLCIKAPSNEVTSRLMNIAENGMLIDLEEVEINGSQLSVCIYVIGEIMDMDTVYNYCQELKDKANDRYRLVFKNNEWELI